MGFSIYHDSNHVSTSDNPPVSATLITPKLSWHFLQKLFLSVTFILYTYYYVLSRLFLRTFFITRHILHAHLPPILFIHLSFMTWIQEGTEESSRIIPLRATTPARFFTAPARISSILSLHQRASSSFLPYVPPISQIIFTTVVENDTIYQVTLYFNDCYAISYYIYRQKQHIHLLICFSVI